MILRYGIPVVSFLLLLFAVAHVFGSRQVDVLQPPPIEPARSPFTRMIAAAGVIESRTENVEVGAPVPGVVVEVFVQVDQKISAGDALFRLDDRHLQAELRTREAEIAAAQAELDRLIQLPRSEELPVATARVREAEAWLADREDQFQRVRRSHVAGIATEEQLVQARQEFGVAGARRERTQAELELLQAGTSEQDLQVARAELARTTARFEQVRTEIDRLVVRAQMNGVVLRVDLRAGEFVNAPPERPSIVLGDIRELHVRVDIDEEEISRFRPDAKAKAAPRGREARSLPLRFVRVEPYVMPKQSLTGSRTERVDTRVLQVIYAVDGPAHGLYVGQQLEIFIESPDEI